MDIKTTLLDRFIAYFAPRAGLTRIQARAANQLLLSKRAYDGAAKGRRTKNWKASSEDAASAIANDLSLLRNRSRDLIRNNPWATKAVNVIVSNTIGTGFIAKVPDGGLSEKWKSWTNGACDFRGEQDFCGLQDLILRAIVSDGDVIIRRHRGTKNRVQLETLESDYLDTTKFDATGRILRGIEYDEKGRRIAYWLYKEHPGAAVGFKSFRIQSVRVPAEEIIMPFRIDRAGQTRGVPWGAPVMMRLRDYDDYEDAQLVRQKIAACFVGFMTDTTEPINEPARDSEDEQKPMSERFEPGMWEVLGPGKEMKFGTPPGVGADYDPYTRRVLQAIATGFGVTYESLTGDYSNVNFSSARMGWLEFQRNIDSWRWKMYAPMVLNRIYQWWYEGEAVDNAKLEELPQLPIWTPPRREMIDPTKEIPAMKDAVRSGFETLSGTVRQLGYEPKEHFAEMKADNEMIDSLQLTLDSDPRKDAQSKGQGKSFGENKPSDE